MDQEIHAIWLLVTYTHTFIYLVYELSDPDNFVDHLGKVPANEWPRLVSRSSMATALKVSLQPLENQ